MTIKTVALLGADGKLGPSILHALLSSEFKVTVLKRQSSTSPSTYPPGVTETRIPDSFPHADLLSALKGQDAVVVTTSGSLIDLQKKVALAAAEAGVQRFIPADFGSVDSESESARALVPLYVHKRNLRLYLSELADKYHRFSWTALVCGHFFDWSLDFMHIYPATRTLDFLDGGLVRASSSSLRQVAKATARILERAEGQETRNRILYCQSFCKSQVEVKEALERVSGEKWMVRDYASEKFKSDKKALMDEGSKEAIEDVVWVLGALEANWEKNDGFAMDVLDLKEEDLDTVVKAALEQ